MNMTVLLHTQPSHVKLIHKGLTSKLISQFDVDPEMLRAVLLHDPRMFFDVYSWSDQNVTILYDFLKSNPRLKFKSGYNASLDKYFTWLKHSCSNVQDYRVQYILARLPFPEYFSQTYHASNISSGLYFAYLKAIAPQMRDELFSRQKLRRLQGKFSQYISVLTQGVTNNGALTSQYLEVIDYFKVLCRTGNKKTLAAKLMTLLATETNWCKILADQLTSMFPEEAAIRDVMSI